VCLNVISVKKIPCSHLFVIIVDPAFALNIGYLKLMIVLEYLRRNFGIKNNANKYKNKKQKISLI
jgi:hypothetical protein